MKNFLLFFFFCAFSFNVYSQVVTGVYKGKMTSDSLKAVVDFELTLKEKDGKLYGYCHRLFIVEDILYYNLVKVTARIVDCVLIVEDEKSVSNNFAESRKGIKTVFFFSLKNDADTVSVLPGEWSTSKWRNNRPMTGTLVVTREQNYLSTQLYKRLEDKKLNQEMAFEEKTMPQPDVVALTKTETKPIVKPSTVTNPADTIQTIAGKIANDTNPQNNKPAEVSNQPKQNLPSAPIVSKPTIKISTDSAQAIAGKITNDTKPQNNKPAEVSNQPKQNLPSAPVVSKPTINTSTDSAQAIAGNVGNENKTQINKPVTPTNQPKQNQASVANPKQQPVVTAPQKQQPTINVVKTETKPVTQKPTAATGYPNQTSIVVVPEKPQAEIAKVGQTKNDSSSVDKPIVATTPPVINNPVITKRAMEIIQTVNITEDSVVLSLYDNGEIDGDTVSVFVNNELVVSKVGLTANAFKKTLYFKPGETLQLTLFAENLGSVPPNTGLLVIYTQNERYQIHFSSTLNKSSSIILLRKE